MSLSNLSTTWLHGSYVNDRNFLLEVAENNPLRRGTDLSGLHAQFDGNNSLAIGYGIDLLVNSNAALNTYFGDATVNVVFSAADQALLTQARTSRTTALGNIDTVNAGISSGTISRAVGIAQISTLKAGLATSLKAVANQLSMNLGTQANAENLLNVVVDQKETQFNQFLTKNKIVIGDSRERATLVSMWYQTPAYFLGKNGSLTGLSRALVNDNRAEAWFEIRYGSNGNNLPGIAARRYFEADYFGLYSDSKSATQTEAFQAYQMLNLHRATIFPYEAKWGTSPTASNPSLPSHQISAANTNYSPSSIVNTLVTDLKPAEVMLFTLLGQKYSVLSNLNIQNYLDTNIYVNPQRASSSDPVAASYSANLDASHSIGNNILIGGVGDDTLTGGRGDDILIAGTGNDSLTAGTGSDTLIGGVGTTTMTGHKGSADTFVYSSTAPDGKAEIDIINAKDCIGIIDVGNTQLIGPGGVGEQATVATAGSQTTWTVTDGNDVGTQYQFDSKTGKLTISHGLLGASGEIIINDFNMTQAQGPATGTGVLGLRFTPQIDIAAGLGNASASFNYSPDNTSVNALGDTQALTLYASAVSNEPQTITLSLAGLDPSQFMVNTGADMLSFNNGTVTLTIPAGEVSVTVGLVRTGDTTQNETAQLTAILNNPNAPSGTAAITSNNLSVSFTSDPSTASNSSSNTVIEGQLQSASDILSYIGDGGNDLINTSTGQNNVRVQDGNNVINGGGGQDYISAGNGNNLIVANGGQEIVLVGNGNNKIYANTQTDIATAMSGRSGYARGKKGDFIGVGDGNNTIVGGTGNDGIFTGTGNNTLVLGPGAVTVIGGVEVSVAKADWTTTLTPDNLIWNNISAASAPFNAPATVYYGVTFNSVPVGMGNDTIFGGAGNSFYYLSNGDNYLDAGGGNDKIWAGIGNNTIFGGTGNDTIVVSGGANYINPESGNDLIIVDGGNSTITGGTGNDTIYSGTYNADWATSITDENNYIDAGSGNSIIYGAGGKDTLIGGSGNDTLFAGDGTEYLQAGDGATTMTGGAGSDTLIGGSGNDMISAGSGNQYLEAGDGNTTMVGGAGNDTLVGGSGEFYVTAGSGNETIIGGSGHAVIVGGAGNDSISAGDGGTDAVPTQVIAGTGNTTIVGGSGVDSIVGGRGTDILYAGDGGDAGMRTQVIAGTGDTTIYGGLGVDNILGGDGNDVIYAGDGGTYDAPTLVTGGSGNATIYGGAGVSQITTGSGSDTLIAGSGTNVFIGGAGTATYQINSDSGSTNIWNSTAGDTLVFGSGVTIDGITASETVYTNGVAVTLTLSGGGSVTIDEGDLSQVSFADGTVATLAQLLSPSLTVGATTYASGNTVLAPSTVASGQNLTLTGSADLTGTGNNVNDVITANSGNDTLIAGTANDTLIGGGASDAYVVSAASGTVTTINGSSGADTLTFTTGVNLADLTASTATASDGSLIVTLQNSVGGSVVIKGGANGNILDQISFADDSTASLGQLLAQLSVGPTAATSAVNVTLAAGIQNMTLTGTANVSATGNAQDNVITANSGNDTLIAGTGNDTLIGGGGTATYVFNAGDTNVVISNSGNADTLVFGAGIGESNLTTTSAVVNGATVVTIADNQGGSVTIQGGGLSQVSFADGSTATLGQLLASSYIAGTTIYSAVSTTAGAGIDTLVMTGSANVTATANALNDTIIANSGNDTLIAGTGNDTLIGGGYDTYVINSGNQVTYIEQSGVADTLSFGPGVGIADLSATATTATDGSATITIQNSLGGTVVIGAGADGLLDKISFSGGGTASLNALLAQANTGITAATSAVNVTLAAGIQNMTLTGTANISATGNAQDNVITANGGHDTLIAGTGNDTLIGGGGTATYVFNAGDAKVVISNSGNADTLVFGAGIGESNLTTTSALVNGVTVVNIADNQGGSVTIQGGGLNQVSFADGSTATLGQLLASSYTKGTTTYSAVSATAGTGIATLAMTGIANVTATANALNDTIIANSGNDTLIAGSGNDTLIGGVGTTTYVVNSYSGITTITQAGTTDILSFGTGISVSNLTATAAVVADGSTTITIADSNGSHVVIDGYVEGVLDKLSFADGSSASLSALLPPLPASGNGADILKSYGWQFDDGDHGTEIYNADGSVTQIRYAPDGSTSHTTVDAQGNSSTKYFSVAGPLIGSRTVNVSTNSAGTQTVTITDNYAASNVLLSSNVLTSDNQGNSTTVKYDANGTIIGSIAVTVNANGSTTTKILGASGQLISSNIAVTNADSSVTTTNYDVNGNVTGSSNAVIEGARLTTTTLFNAAGVQIGSSKTSSDGQGDSDTLTYDMTGASIGDSWKNADGTAGSATLNADVSSSRTTQTADGGYIIENNDGKGNIIGSQYNAAGVKTSDTWQKANNTHGSDIFNADGSSTAFITKADGSYSVGTNDGKGTVVTTSFSVNDTETGYSEQVPDGTLTAYVLHSDGSSTETVTLSNGNTTTTQFSPGGTETADSWTKTDGTSGTDIFSGNGFFSGTVRNIDGTSSSIISDGNGDLTSTNFNLAGTRISDTWTKSDGTSGSDTFNAGGSSSGTTLNPDGTSSSYVNDGKGDLTKTNYDASGKSISDTWTKSDGSSGADNFNSDGSKSGSTTSANGAVTTYAVDKNGNTVIVGPEVTNAVTAQIVSMENSFSANLISSLESQLNAEAVEANIDNAMPSGVSVFNINVTPIGVNVVNSDDPVIQGSGSGVQIQSTTSSNTITTTAMERFVTATTKPGQPLYQAFAPLLILEKLIGSPTRDFEVYYLPTGKTTPSKTSYQTRWEPVTTATTTTITNYTLAGNIEEIDAGSHTNTIYLGNGPVIVNAGSADTIVGPDGTSAANRNDQAYEIENLTGFAGNPQRAPGLGFSAPVATSFIYGGSGNDTLLGSGGNDTIVAGIGNNFMNGGGGRDTYVINTDVNQGVDIIDDTGFYNLADYTAPMGSSEYWDLQLLQEYGGRIPTPDEVANDFLHTVEFNGSATPNQLKFSFVAVATAGNRMALNISWGTSASVEVVLGDPGMTGEGVQQFTFSNGTTLSMSQMLALAAVQPDSGTSTVAYADGSYTSTVNDGQGNITSIDFSAGWVKTGDNWSKADGSSGMDILNVDDSYVTTLNDGHGHLTTTNFGAGGILIGDNWRKADGSTGTDTFNANGSSSGNTRSLDGSTSTYVNDGYGNIDTQTFDAQGHQTSDVWKSNDGTFGTTTYSYDASGNQIGDTWTQSDGTYGSDTFNSDGSSGGTTYNADGSYSTYVNDGHGTVVTKNDDVSGNLLGSTTALFDSTDREVSDTWTKVDGSAGSDAFNADGSSSGATTNVGGISSSYVNDGQGDVVTTNFGTSDNKVGDTWIKSDGSSGSDTFNSDGTTASSTVALGDANQQVTLGDASTTVTFGSGTDQVVLGNGNDVLTLGGGNDTVVAGASAGSASAIGQATVVASSVGTSELLFANANSDQLWFQRSGNDLDIGVIGTLFQLDVSSWYVSSSNHVQSIVAADGKTLIDSNVDALVSAMASFSPPASGATALPDAYQTQLQPVIAANWH